MDLQKARYEDNFLVKVVQVSPGKWFGRYCQLSDTSFTGEYDGDARFAIKSDRHSCGYSYQLFS